MLLVPTEVKASPIHGFGCYALEDIKEGTEVWEFSLIFDTLVEVYIAENAFDELQYEFLCTYAYTDGDYLLMSGDQSRYLNHSEAPNLGADPKEDLTAEDEGTMFDSRFALRDIAAGEELTEYYLMEDDADDD